MKPIYFTDSNFRLFLQQRGVRAGERNVRLIGFLVAAVVVLLLMLGIGTRLQNAFSPPVKSASGDLAVDISSFVEAIPRSGSEAYDRPSRSEREQMGKAIEAIEAGNLSRAAFLVDSLAYDVVQYEDTDTGRTYAVLSERRNADGSWPHAWGMYIFSPEADSDTVVEVVHPIADLDSEKVGLETFRKANARYLFITGAHRKANTNGTSDVAHASTSVFEQIHGVAVGPSTKVFQPHGFSQKDHPNYGEIVASAGTGDPTSLSKSTQDTLLTLGFDARLYDGVSYLDAGATTNVQGSSTRAVGANFLHLEVNRSIRKDDLRRALLTDALADSLR